MSEQVQEEKPKKKLEERLEEEPVRIGCQYDLTEKRRAYNASRTGSALLMSYDQGVHFKCVRGPIGNGKSVLMCMYIVHKSQQQEVIEVTEKGKTFKVRWSKWLIVRHTFKSLEETTIATWDQWFGDKTRWVSNPFEGRYEDYGPDGILTRIDFICLASESKNILNDLQSLELSGAWINEAVQCPYNVVARVFSRLKRFNPNPASGIMLKTFHVIMDTNSPNELNWWRTKEEVECPDGWLFFVCPPAVLQEKNLVGKIVYVPNDVENAARHNRRPAENVKEIDGGYHRGMSYWTDMLSVLDEDDIRMLLMNQFGLNVSGMGVFSEVWNAARMRISAEETKIYKGLRVVCGLDLGRTPGAVFGQVETYGRLVMQHEATTWNQRLNNKRGGLERMDVMQFFDTKMLPLLAEVYGYPNCNLTIFADPAGKNYSEAYSVSAIERLQNERGLNVIPCDKVQSSVTGETDITHGNSSEIRISVMKNALRTGQLVISENCRMLCEGMAGKYCYETIKSSAANGGTLQCKDTPCKNEWSHINDGGQYLTLAVFRGAEDYSKPLARLRENSYANLVGAGGYVGGYL